MFRRNSFVSVVLTAALIWSTSPQVTWATPNDTAFQDLLERVGIDSEKGDTTNALSAIASYVRQETYRLDDNEKLKVISEYMQASVDYCNRPGHSERSIRACYEAAKEVSLLIGIENEGSQLQFAGSSPAHIGMFLFGLVVGGLAFFILTNLLVHMKSYSVELIYRDLYRQLSENGLIDKLTAQVEVKEMIFKTLSRYRPGPIALKSENFVLTLEDLIVLDYVDIVRLKALTKWYVSNGKAVSNETILAFDSAIEASKLSTRQARIKLAKSLLPRPENSTTNAAQIVLAPIVVSLALDAAHEVDDMTPQEISELRVKAGAITKEAIEERIANYRQTHGLLETFTPQESE